MCLLRALQGSIGVQSISIQIRLAMMCPFSRVQNPIIM